MKKLHLHFTIVCVFILVAAFSRMIPHMSNFSPLGAIALFGAAHFKKSWQAFLIPIAATWLSDLFINNVIYAQFYPEFSWVYSGFYWQYTAYILIAAFGLLLYKRGVSVGKIFGGAIGSGAIFFLISNFGCWIGSTIYPQNFSGLMSCMAAGIPFYKGTLLGDLVYCSALFGGYAILQKKLLTLRTADLD
ncbi:MAG: hypothetical protein IPI60_06275 [Saprospiraceae bacterium]|nr:hypothetical protein [Saprospiraceae bacterium]